jgi:heme/copper-type cytochrome/quinol oxidase subunit 1
VVASADQTPQPAPQAAQSPGLLAWVTTVDYKRIGILYLLTTLGFFLLGGLESVLMRIQLAVPRAEVMSPFAYNSLFPMHGTTMIFLVVMPMLLGCSHAHATRVRELFCAADDRRAICLFHI